MTTPGTLQEAVVWFNDPENANKFMVAIRWPEGVVCPTCGNRDVHYLASRRIWECKTKHPKRQFSAKVGTIFEDSPIDLGKWFMAMWLIANAKNGVSSYEISRALKVTQKTAWFMLHRVRLAMQTGTFEKLSGTVEIDETYIGGRITNMHAAKRKQIGKGPRGDKTIVMGLLSRKGRVQAKVIANTDRATLRPIIEANVQAGSEVITDAHGGYRGYLDAAYVHRVIDHAVAYVQGHVYTNTLENFWTLLKRMIRGTYVSVEPQHLTAYLDEEAFRYNERDRNDGGRFLKVLRAVPGRRLTYKELVGASA